MVGPWNLSFDCGGTVENELPCGYLENIGGFSSDGVRLMLPLLVLGRFSQVRLLPQGLFPSKPTLTKAFSSKLVKPGLLPCNWLLVRKSSGRTAATRAAPNACKVNSVRLIPGWSCCHIGCTCLPLLLVGLLLMTCYVKRPDLLPPGLWLLDISPSLT